MNKPIAIVLLGPQGSGKGTLAYMIKERSPEKNFQVLTMSTLLAKREAQDQDPNTKARHGGDLNPDKLVISILNEEMDTYPSSTNFILDGCVRTPEQGCAVTSMLEERGCQFVFAILRLSKEQCVKRIAHRVSQLKKENLHHLVRPDDDDPTAVVRRLSLYFEHITPIFSQIRSGGSTGSRWMLVNAGRTPDGVHGEFSQKAAAILEA